MIWPNEAIRTLASAKMALRPKVVNMTVRKIGIQTTAAVGAKIILFQQKRIANIALLGLLRVPELRSYACVALRALPNFETLRRRKLI